MTTTRACCAPRLPCVLAGLLAGAVSVEAAVGAPVPLAETVALSSFLPWSRALALVLGALAAVSAAFVIVALMRALRRTAEDLRHAERLLQAVTECAPMLLRVTDEAGRCVFASRSYLQRTGLPIDHVLGEGWLRAVHHDDRPAVEARVAAAIRAGEGWMVEYRLIDGGGGVHHVAEYGRPRRDVDGTLLGHVAGTIAASAGAGWMNGTNEALDTLTPALAHLASETTSDMMLATLNGIIDCSRLAAGTFELEHEPFDLVVLAREVLTATKPQASVSAIRLGLELDRALPVSVVGDRGRLRRVLMQSLAEVIEAGGTPEVRLHLTTVAGAPDDACDVRFEIRDGCTGPAADVRHQQFERLAGDVPEDADPTGSGLSLAIVLRLVAAMGGTLGFTRTVGVGCTLWFSLRLGVAHTRREARDTGLREAS